MVTLSNLIKYEVDDWTRLSCRVEGLENYCNAYGKKFDTKEIWIATKNEYSDFVYSRAVTPQVRQAGNRLSGLTETAYASLLA